jgi:hypothetical protein
MQIQVPGRGPRGQVGGPVIRIRLRSAKDTGIDSFVDAIIAYPSHCLSYLDELPYLARVVIRRHTSGRTRGYVDRSRLTTPVDVWL